LNNSKTKTQPNNASTNIKNTYILTPKDTNTTISSSNTNHTQKTFAEMTANLSFSKKDQAIIFNTIDGTP
jgi:hypothetical protein